jgi:hypothetical protein
MRERMWWRIVPERLASLQQQLARVMLREVAGPNGAHLLSWALTLASAAFQASVASFLLEKVPADLSWPRMSK